MKKMLLSAAMLIAACSVNAQTIYALDGEAFMTAQGAADPGTATTVAAGTVITENEDFKLSIGGEDGYKASGAQANNYETVTFGDVTMDLDGLKGLTASNNAKGPNGEDPASTFVAPATGCYYTLYAKKDGVVYVVHKASSNKAYAVFEEGTCLAYDFAMQLNEGADPNDNPCGNILSYSLPADEDGYYDTSNGTILQPIQIYHSDVDPGLVASAGNGFGVIKFNVYAECNYIFSAIGSKMTLGGVCYSESPVDVVIGGTDGDGNEMPAIKLMSADGSVGITEVVADEAADADAPAYNIAGQRVNKDAKGIVIINGKKYLNK